MCAYRFDPSAGLRNRVGSEQNFRGDAVNFGSKVRFSRRDFFDDCHGSNTGGGANVHVSGSVEPGGDGRSRTK